ncbi:erythronate-4-phosphate dehydrogenase [Shewanella sp. NFH-SH190041]|nr:erythronate-4-phosphate dehydrogenase [Shewanella sp. NFH-SH190041]
MMRIIADENMPFVSQLFEPLGEVSLVDGRSLSPSHLIDADVLLVRSVTQVNAALLSQANRLSFIGSATIGTDHIDQQLLISRSIEFAHAPGCNATAVGEFAFMAMLELAGITREPLAGKKVGIVGAGNTGSALARCLAAYHVEYLLCDPLLAEADTHSTTSTRRQYTQLDELIHECDVISLHVPLTREGPYPTWHLFDHQRLAQLRPGCWLINTSRGDVIDNPALLQLALTRPDIKLALDVWAGEPTPISALIERADIATPHIAGYSLEGRARGTLMLRQQLARLQQCEVDIELSDLLPEAIFNQLTLSASPDEAGLRQLCRLVYDLRDDDKLFRFYAGQSGGFDQMRRNHRHRRELSVLTLVNEGAFEVDWLTKLGFSGVNL